ncbi:MAG: FG-GAP-like repeat-containing protein, partial [Planctomycetaceae bacterium]|nr:FG-GAP-like repeat-containing protein [Planctomycetaceae bacterium]
KRLDGYSALVRLLLITRQTELLRNTIRLAERQHADLIDDPVLLWLWVVGDTGQWGSADAEEWLRQAAKNDPQNAVVAAALARTLLQESRSEEARKLWTASFADQDDAWPLRLVRAEWEVQSGAFAAAAATLATMPDEADFDPQTWLVRAQLVVAEEKLPLALALIEQALHRNPLLVEAAYLRGRLLDRLGRTEESRSQLTRAAQLDQLLQRTLQLLQQSSPEAADALTAAELAAELQMERWAELVTNWAVRRAPKATVPDRLQALRQRAERPPSLSVVIQSNHGLLRQQFDRRSRTSIKTKPLRPSADPSELRLRDVTAAMKLDFQYEYGHAPERWLMETLGGGVAAMDYDRDGCLDLFFAQAGRLSVDAAVNQFQPCALFRNIAGTSFENVTPTADAGTTGYFHGCVAGDFNEDGFVDLVLCGYSQTTLLCNQGDGTWIDRTAAAGLTNDRWTTSGTVMDWDRDGDLDLYQAAYCDAPLSAALRTCRDGSRFEACRPNAYSPARDLLWENRGDGTFAPRTDEELKEDRGYGLGAVAADFDSDGWDDVFVGNDTTANFLWWNEGQGKSLSEGGLAAGVGLDGNGRAEACMGIACGDVDGNGLLDLFVTNFHDETATLYINHGGRLFTDETDALGLSNAGRKLMGWGTQFVDFNADGWLDIVILNGHLHDTPQLPQLYLNAGGKFVECSATAGDFFQRAALGRSVAVGDFNGDGRDDLAISHQTGPAAILQNDSQTGGMVRLQLVGTESNRDAVGTMVRARVGDRELVRRVTRQGGYLSSSTADISLGLGTAIQIDKLEIVWPGGHVERHEIVPAGTEWLLREARPPMTLVRPRD